MPLREPRTTSYFHRNATLRTQIRVHESSAVLQILHLICDDSALSLRQNLEPPGPRAAPARAQVLGPKYRAHGALLDFEFEACSLSGKCIISRTAELSRYRSRTLCGPCTAFVPGECASEVALRFYTTYERPCAPYIVCGTRHVPRRRL